ncbi:Helix-turn-helix domain-containing protein [Dyadobacter soli]|uniref:Helix-turn-helix domain-containing protein n=1 Tax=Dyadobacter soli TaxID=659014 RepID=A0A1G7D1N7_9BACT|nr:helix-turn-helix domain-containing protein [Dyadobacter soli]SDE45604.1 Helix-turn-helix domain-containing protein [Dyadobacter soli]
MNNPLLIGLATGAAFLLAFLLIDPPGHRNLYANRWLAIFAATLGCAMLEIFLHNLDLQHDYRVLADLAEVSRFLSAPALYLSIACFVSPERRFRRIELLHLLPFVLFLLLIMTHMISGRNVEINLAVAKLFFGIIGITLPLQTVVYWALSYGKLRVHQRNIREVVSSTDLVDLRWLQKLLWVLAGVICLWLNLAFFELPGVARLTPFLYLVAIYFLSYFALRQGEVYAFSKESRQEIQSLVVETAGKPARQKRVDDAVFDDLKTRLEELMQSQKPYLDPALSLPSLAGKLGISVHELSYVVNEAYEENFFAFVNRYRVTEAKRLLLSDAFEKLNILGVAYESGFNSKTTFNTTFKKLTGQSPTDFVRSGKL